MRGMGERALLIVNPGAGKRHAKDGDLAECVRLLTAAGFDIDLREESFILKKIELAFKEEQLKIVLDLAQIDCDGGVNHARVLAVYGD